MTKKGFTLIELLAVIVILAVIVLIATPMILNVIEKAKIDASEDSAKGYLDAFEQQIITSETNSITDGIYAINNDNNSLLNKNRITYHGKGPTKGEIVVINNKITRAELCVNGYSIALENDKLSYNEALNYCDESILYKDNDNIDTEVSNYCIRKSGIIGSYEVGDEFICDPGDGEKRNFYILSVSSDNISMIMNKNLNNSATTSWNDSGINTDGAITAISYLKKETIDKGWTLKVFLPTGQQIADASNDVNWNSSNFTGALVSPWLRDYFEDSTNSVVGAHGYWTSTAYAGDTSNAWYVIQYGFIGKGNIIDRYYVGVRPVILVTK